MARVKRGIDHPKGTVYRTPQVGNGVGEYKSVLCTSFPPGPSGTSLGHTLNPDAVENLGLQVFTATDGGDPAVSGAMASSSKEALAGVDGPREKPATVELEASAGGGKPKEQEHQPFVFSQGFPPVPAKLVGKILRLEFVDMAELLRDNIEAERRRGSHVESASNPKRPRREVPDILSWLQCFGIYISVTASKFPERVPHMLAYQTTLVREARRCGGSGWLAYDTAFRQQAAADPLCDWSKLNSSLYPVTFMAQANGKGKCCPHCLEPDHVGEECALSSQPRQENRQQQRSPGLSLPAQGTSEGYGEPRGAFPALSRQRGRTSRQVPQRGGTKICYSYNDGECRFPSTCRYLHICQRCQADDHPACNCTAYGAGKKDSAK